MWRNRANLFGGTIDALTLSEWAPQGQPLTTYSPTFDDILRSPLIDDLTSSCPTFPVWDRQKLQANAKPEELATAGAALHKVMSDILSTHCCPFETFSPIGGRPLLSIGDAAGLTKQNVEGMVDLVLADAKHFEVANKALGSAIYAAEGSFFFGDGRISASRFRRELEWFGSRLAHTGLLFLTCAVLLVIFTWRAVGVDVGRPASWLAAGSLATGGALLGWLDLWHLLLVWVSSILALAIAALLLAALQPVVRRAVRIAAAIGAALLPVGGFAGWLALASSCRTSVGAVVWTERFVCWRWDYDIRLSAALIGIAIMLVLGEGYLALLRRAVVKPR
jgi:hypothetical protein